MTMIGGMIDSAADAVREELGDYSLGEGYFMREGGAVSAEYYRDIVRVVLATVQELRVIITSAIDEPDYRAEAINIVADHNRRMGFHGVADKVERNARDRFADAEIEMVIDALKRGSEMVTETQPKPPHQPA